MGPCACAAPQGSTGPRPHWRPHPGGDDREAPACCPQCRLPTVHGLKHALTVHVGHPLRGTSTCRASPRASTVQVPTRNLTGGCPSTHRCSRGQVAGSASPSLLGPRPSAGGWEGGRIPLSSSRISLTKATRLLPGSPQGAWALPSVPRPQGGPSHAICGTSWGVLGFPGDTSPPRSGSQGSPTREACAHPPQG